MALLFISKIAIYLVAWLSTYAIHSTIFTLLLFTCLKILRNLHPYAKEILLKTTLVAGIFTAFLHLLGQGQYGQFQITRVAPSVQSLSPLNNKSPKTQVTPSTPSVVSNALSTQISSPTPTFHWTTILLMIWLGTVALLVLKLRRCKKHFKQSLQYLEFQDTLLLNILHKLTQKIHLKQPVQLKIVQNNISPLVLNKYTIVVPLKTLELTQAQQESMLAHELAHLKRRDHLWLMVYHWLSILFFFQPLNHWLYREIHEVTEEICDAKAVQITQNRQALAQCLVEVAQWLIQQPQWVVAMASKKLSLTKRVQQLLNNQYMKNSKNNRVPFHLALASIVTTIGLLAIFIMPGIQASWAQSSKTQAKKTFKAYTLNVKKSSRGKYRQAIVIKNPQGDISEFYLDDQKYTASDLNKFGFIRQALKKQNKHALLKAKFVYEMKKIQIEAQQAKYRLEEKYLKNSKITDKATKKANLKELKLEAERVKKAHVYKMRALELKMKQALDSKNKD